VFYYPKEFSFWDNKLYSTDSIVVTVMTLFVHAKHPSFVTV